MLVVVSYDVSTKDPKGARRLRRVAKTCIDYGQRVQNSVFECVLDFDHWPKLKLRLLSEIDPDQDSIRFYYLGSNFQRRVEHHGTKAIVDLEAPLVL